MTTRMDIFDPTLSFRDAEGEATARWFLGQLLEHHDGNICSFGHRMSTAAVSLAVITVAMAACSFDPSVSPPAGESLPDASSFEADAAAVDPAEPDASPGVEPEDIAFIGPDGEFFGTADVVAADGATIDTTALTVGGSAVGPGVVFDVWPDESGQDIAVLHVRDFDLPAGAAVRVIGDRPLAIVAGGEVTIAGVLDLAATANLPGPGGYAPQLGPGCGRAGGAQHALDGGGGGAGFGGYGAAGGAAQFLGDVAPGGAGGDDYGDSLQALSGGSGGGYGGGYPDPCVSGVPGAGGGAVLVYAATRIAVGASGGINAGGGGGGGGRTGLSCDYEGGNGGGSGGTIALQSPDISALGILAANGGGGGGGSGLANGSRGQDGTLSTDPALGGPAGGSIAGAGGFGGTASAVAAPGGITTVDIDGNGGGGGGSAGRVYLLTLSQE